MNVQAPTIYERPADTEQPVLAQFGHSSLQFIDVGGA